ncbi:MAG: hypothetical protein WBN75_20420 [Verrucomicrobiia bacterium]
MKKRSLLFALSLVGGSLVAVAQGTAFNYQGKLTDGANPANGIYDLQFTVYDAAGGGNVGGGGGLRMSPPR